MRISKVTTKTGDKGGTGLGDGKRVSKDHPHIVFQGDLDELNSFLGLTVTACNEKELVTELKSIQQDIFNIGGEASMPGTDMELFSKDRINILESSLEKMNKFLPPLTEFILPGGDELSARIHVVRAVCRRVERSCVTLMETGTDVKFWLIYLNRLSDYFFVLARFISQNHGEGETLWERNN
ncbi:MAG: cob(I)yrinic acid a,c-diamide adenosyltransferase [Candidatus Marinimicrobia bacterium]|jgi:cob(I)alamin adenosyltransferase|nr:cob(I)yrinic acid a,c-diamide adenosyltransferase [Candidatus Neomarinimicrobiota bacterium]MBT3676233.1 cob(I)yrinic acid a,c-diamide adenosyltransferase [Candidatus Neomarinimicrobiota bacterium]MBT3763116.1 cob(I)yrinic acid a,c-diamide adenosyltransferase [Candidatus Neomarinimicrobiota bacterium]MBT4067410.1 cob(I)yrinic acid a,c-diamide adenosyltransferase [Candidatus Neomarinimicrobiota bacterium]MBT4270857.1 cob(I)yrinic acid a,c-diamide adenosyltransferase [Candidatus Neomarinimicro